MKWITMVALLFTVLAVKAQSNEAQAFQKFKEGREKYHNEDYAGAAADLLKTRELLGETNVRIQPMLVTSLMKIENWPEASKQVQDYFALEPNEELVEYVVMVAAQNTIQEKLKAEQEAYETAISKNDDSYYKAYLRNWPYGRYRDEVRERQRNLYDDNAWESAWNIKTSAALWSYLDQYPSGRHAEEAAEYITYWDVSAWKKAQEAHTISSYEYYLNNYPRGEYRTEAQSRLSALKDIALRAYNKEKYHFYKGLAKQNRRKGVGKSVGGVLGLAGNLTLLTAGTAAWIYSIEAIDYDDYAIVYLLGGSFAVGWAIGRLATFDKFGSAKYYFRQAREYDQKAEQYTYF